MLLYPRIAVIILMSQYLTSFYERDQRKERKTLNRFSSNVDSFTFCNTVTQTLRCAFTGLVEQRCLRERAEQLRLFYIIYAYFLFVMQNPAFLLKAAVILGI